MNFLLKSGRGKESILRDAIAAADLERGLGVAEMTGRGISTSVQRAMVEIINNNLKGQ